MSGRKRDVRLKVSEINHVLALLNYNQDDGFCAGNPEQYWTRHYAIKLALLTALAQPKPKPKPGAP